MFRQLNCTDERYNENAYIVYYFDRSLSRRIFLIGVYVLQYCILFFERARFEIDDANFPLGKAWKQ